ncbi:BgTH12-07165 [Blumeria graminis f. sp. triticale]|uniref:tRNA ligase n=1 Tax=Blumeria graminis f. sp. triticale TaxID=1689686 RepID=A0A9W4D8M7_BLUGR|nr:BgTH12-07165 [Blumeria graminis f. sp. triticale]
MDLSKAIYAPQVASEVSALVGRLKESCKKPAKKSFMCKESIFNDVGSHQNLVVSSWRFREWDYRRTDLPVYARGLFTGKNEKDQDEIIIRGYDKFFNNDEVSATKWNNIETTTQGPYEVSLKENGCIIFISGLCDGSLLVTSKHSTGSRDSGISHAVAGEERINLQLAKLGRAKEDLAMELRTRNVTAVAELCDDSFEEHILPYTGENSGLYLHGLNLNIPKFVTYPGIHVQDFAEKWGFRKTESVVFKDIKATRNFLEEAAKTGSYNGRNVEGFVIRCKVPRDSSNELEDWFFKYKFEEPYLLYRQWRECTKAMISKQPLRLKKKIAVTEEYLKFAERRLSENPELAKAYQDNHGIIKLREDFLKEKSLSGSDIIKKVLEDNRGTLHDVVDNIILVPIGTLGCGKTTIAVALSHLFQWEIVQNDNIQGKGRPPRFVKEVLAKLEERPVVFADRNNTERRERRQLLEDVSRSHPQTRIVALHFVHSLEAYNRIRQVTQARVISRGDNHQTIQASSDKDKVISIMENFMDRFQAFNAEEEPDSKFDAVVDLDPTLDSRKNLETVIEQLRTLFPKLIGDMPNKEDLDDAINYAIHDYKMAIQPRIPGHLDNSVSKQNNSKNKLPSKKLKPMEYFCVTLPTAQILQTVTNCFESVSSNEIRYFWKLLNRDNRIQTEFHVTLAHQSSAKSHPELWQKYMKLYSEACEGDLSKNRQKIGQCKIYLERLVWDERIMAIVVRLVDKEWDCVNQVAHITIGTSGKKVKPKESNDMLEKWLQLGPGGYSRIKTLVIEGFINVEGTVIGVLSN